MPALTNALGALDQASAVSSRIMSGGLSIRVAEERFAVRQPDAGRPQSMAESVLEVMYPEVPKIGACACLISVSVRPWRSADIRLYGDA